MNSIRTDWDLENGGSEPDFGRTRAPQASPCTLGSAICRGPLHGLCKMLQATRNKLQSVSGPFTSAADPIDVVELPAGTTRKTLTDLSATAVRSALIGRGLLDPARPQSSVPAPRASRRQQGRWARHQPRPRTRGRQS